MASAQVYAGSGGVMHPRATVSAVKCGLGHRHNIRDDKTLGIRAAKRYVLSERRGIAARCETARAVRRNMASSAVPTQEDHDMDGKTVAACIDAAHAALKEHAQEIEALDQQIGDGDHIFNLLRGMDTPVALRDQIEARTFGAALELAGTKVLSTVGGSSGPLFFSLLQGMAMTSATLPDVDAERTSIDAAARIFAGGVDAVARRGKTGIGSKTMMDVLIPVAARLTEMASAGAGASAVLDALPQVAEENMLATRDMLATKGRASFLGERSRAATSTPVRVRAN
jgi:phosphoenolpyruvate---glycerone phosphotransferase subunit DhaL